MSYFHVWVWFFAILVSVLFISLLCYCWKWRMDVRMRRLGLQERIPPRRSFSVADTESSCGWCRYWWGDRNSATLPTAATLEMGEMEDELGTLNPLSRKSFSNRSNSIESAVQNIRSSPKLSSRSSRSPAGSLPIHVGGRRLSHDPFLLCQDLQTMELQRKSVQFERRRKSEQALPSYKLPSNKRKSPPNS